ncbi:hypothetical protein [Streptomyces sp. AK02-01A]|uniref:hypothetical protein n=1 Tax=Streptomyces sp. AK02-01A TaxID=3028648 RepID=UPI0029A91E07|nr:hypothetical protein [Streptomyces sp. AK02-01A]MDX3853414.1 hypothetical protein [Streptomyces sp. AK02-01A]
MTGARALIDAAIDARRLGLGPALPPTLLEVAAGGYLTDTQWNELSDRLSGSDSGSGRLGHGVRDGSQNWVLRPHRVRRSGR